MKNAGVDAVYLPLVLSTNLAIVQTAAQNNLKFKLAVLATGYGQALLDQPAAQAIGPEVLFAQAWTPVELKTAATKKFVSDLTKYTSYKGVPDFGVYTGYLTADLLIKGLEAAGKNLTRDGFITATKGLDTWDAAGLSCQPVDVSGAGLRHRAQDSVQLVRADQEREVRALSEQASRSAERSSPPAPAGRDPHWRQ